jgi:hypothetical protein
MKKSPAVCARRPFAPSLCSSQSNSKWTTKWWHAHRMHWSRPTSFSLSTLNTCQRIISTRRKMSHLMLHSRSSNSLPTNLSLRYQAFSARSRTHLKKLKNRLTIKKLSKMTTNSTLAQPRVTSWALSLQRRCTSMWQMSRRPLGRHTSLAWPSSSQSYSRAMHNSSSTLIS